MKKYKIAFICFAIPLFAIEGYFDFYASSKPLYWKIIWLTGLTLTFVFLLYMKKDKTQKA